MTEQPIHLTTIRQMWSDSSLLSKRNGLIDSFAIISQALVGVTFPPSFRPGACRYHAERGSSDKTMALNRHIPRTNYDLVSDIAETGKDSRPGSCMVRQIDLSASMVKLTGESHTGTLIHTSVEATICWHCTLLTPICFS